MKRTSCTLSAAALLLAVVLLAPATPLAAQAGKVPITLDGAPPSPDALFSPAVRVGDVIFLSGSIGSVPGQGLVEGGIRAEARQVILNLERSLQAAGAGLDDLAKCTVFLADIGEFAAMNEVWLEMIPSPRPARSTVAVAALVRDARIEIECMAAAPAG